MVQKQISPLRLESGTAAAGCDFAEWRARAEIPGQGRVEETGEAAHDAATGIVTIRHLYRYLDQGLERRALSRIRFIGKAHLARLIEEAGLAPLAFYGWWDRSPVTPESPEIIAVLGRRK